MLTAKRELRIKQLVNCLSAALALGTAVLPTTGGAVSAAGLAQRMEVLLGAPLSSGVLRNVVSCDDDGSIGTLRQVIGISADGDGENLTGLTCSTITLVSGEIRIPQGNLYMRGPTDHTLTITTSMSNRLLHHTGTSRLAIYDLTLSNGKYFSSTGSATGGCVKSYGDVHLYSTVVTGCGVEVTTPSATPSVAQGGAIYASNGVELNFSRITGNTAIAFNGHRAYGGGVMSNLGLRSYVSTLSGNSAIGIGSSVGAGGAAVFVGKGEVKLSTIDSNEADLAGAVYQIGVASDSVKILESTISGNTANVLIGGIFATSPLRIENSTVAFNSANSDAAIFTSASVIAYSSIIAKNSISTGVFADLYVSGAASTLTGANNLIMSSNLGLFGTLTGDPKLAPLANHGGSTRTHALLPGSPAIDQGNNLARYPADQRRTSQFLREVPSGSPDIGAYERQLNDDEVFYDGLQ